MEKVTILITSFNYEKYIEKCILSCLNQKNFSEYEVLVVDDGSTDGTRSILEKYSGRIRCFTNPNRGIEHASNFGVKHSRSEYFVRVDADDMLRADYLEKVYTKIVGSDFAFVYSSYYLINGEDEVVATKSLPGFDAQEIRCRGDFLATGTMYDKRMLTKMNLYNEATKNCGLENYELILSLLKNNYKGYCLPEPLFYYRQHGSNISMSKREFIVGYGKGLARKFGLPGYQSNENHPWGLRL